MSFWKITALYYGQLTLPKSVFAAGIDDHIKIDFPLSGFLLRNGKENILVDTGMKESYFEQMAIGDVNPKGSTQILLDELAKENLTPDNIDKVIYTHLHYDHCGNIDLFPNAVTYIQKSEYANLLNPYAFQQARMDYFPDTAAQLTKIKKILFVDGDMKLSNGLELYLTKGHSLGGQTIVVPTEKGRYVLTGDIPSTKYCLFPELDKMTLMNGEIIDITPIKDGSITFLLGTFTTDCFEAYDTHYKQLLLGEKPEPEYFLPSHDPENIYRRHFG